MKRILLLIFPLIFNCHFLNAQGELEILEYGWSPGFNKFKPCYADLDQDGLLDMIVGHRYGRFLHYEQTESASYSFKLIEKKFNNNTSFDVFYAHPVLFDIDNDQLYDLIVGTVHGTLLHYEQTEVGSYSFDSIQASLSGIDLNNHAMPCFADIDNDGLIDLLVGEQVSICHYEQESVNSYTFIHITDNFAGIEVEQFDYCSPTIIDIDNDNLLDLVVADNGPFNNHGIMHYEQVAPGSYEFNPGEINFEGDLIYHITKEPEFFDIDNDSKLDIIFGPRFLLEQSEENSYDFNLLDNSYLMAGGHVAMEDIDNDGFVDLLAGSYHYKQTSTNLLEFNLITTNFFEPTISGEYPVFTNINNNGLLDLVFGTDEGNIKWFEQSNQYSVDFDLIADDLGNIELDYGFASPDFADLDSDGLLDMLVGNNYLIKHYEQESIGSSDFVLLNEDVLDYDFDFWLHPKITDLDNDSLYDILLGSSAYLIYRFEQESINSYNFQFVTDHILEESVWGGFFCPAFYDVDQNGSQDMILHSHHWGLQLFLLTPVPLIVKQPNNIEVCESEQLKLSVNVNGAPEFIFEWQQNGIGISGESDSVLFIENAQVNQAGQYQCIVTNSWGVDSSDIVMVEVYHNPMAGFTDSLNCMETPVVFTNISFVQNSIIVDQTWDFGDGSTSNLSNPAHTYSEIGYYPVQLSVLTNDGCADSIVKNVLVHELPVADFTSSIACYPDSTLFIDNSTAIADSIKHWNWNFGDGNISNLHNPKHVYTAPGDYNVLLSVLTQHDCPQSINKNVTVQQINSEFAVSNPCIQSDGTVFTNSSSLSGSGNLTYYWVFEDGQNITDSIPVIIFDTIGVIPVAIINSSEACLDTLSREVEIFHPIEVSFDTLYEVCKAAYPVELAGGSPEGGIYEGVAVISDTFYPEQAGLGFHEITYTYVDENTCVNKSIRDIEVSDCSIPEYACADWIHLFPNPTKNDVRFFVDMDFETLKLSIFTSVGNRVKTISFSDIKGQNIYKIDVAGFLNTGVYYFKFEAQGKMSTCKIIVEPNE